ncbi:hypothetical protein [Mycolicibacterium litorale]|uniref:Uncharacterized protein n=1 Tax=Mycolicibacterium litorale TaxID=758802 RepID=A0AAD1MV89_9MYCO|nr:hypothetical protein [Mycolicibacterium litorale]MCV7416483.1 hypothetical protein [Mycolicibacterium litorale]TDY09737.1 hypothetical protein BCL50_1834 [Mycolicibacterium litorale]BBY17683.1 hypothetical protein MLIT_32750 [Mycolicibacterium litorale]
MDAVNDGSLAPVQPAAARRAKPADRHTVQSVLLTAVFIVGVVGIIGALVLGQSTAAIIIALLSGAIITGTVC